MKKLTLIFFALALCATLLYSCTHASPTVFTNATMRPWFDNHCGGCHRTNASDAGAWEYNPYDATTIQNNISQLYKVIYTRKSMPRQKLSTSELEVFKTWYNSGQPTN